MLKKTLDHTFYNGDALEVLRTLPSESVNCCVTSPPYYSLRDYGVAGQIGMEATPEEYVAKLAEVFREVWRVLQKDGTVWVNLGDSYANNPQKGSGHVDPKAPGKGSTRARTGACKPKDMIGIPWRVAFALQADGWYLRSDIIWCLSGGTWLYVKTQKGEMPMTVKDMARLNPKTVKLWNGEKWTQLLGISCSDRRGDELEIVIRSGERISCTPTHKFPTNRGLLEASDIVTGDVLMSCILPEPDATKDCAIDEDAAWFAGLYIAEGSRSGDTIQIAGHAKEMDRWARIQKIAAKYGGTATRTLDGNKGDIRVYGKVLNALIYELVAGKTARDKGFSSVTWRYSNKFIRAILEGYLSGDGHWDKNNSRWRLGFTRNYNLERDIRTACARLGYRLTLNLSSADYQGRKRATFRGEIRIDRSGHHNQKTPGEVVEIRKARCRKVYDLGVEDEPHIFSLASGILTHNSKPNPMPESVTDRPTRAHEYIFLLSKSEKYYYDAVAIREKAVGDNLHDLTGPGYKAPGQTEQKGNRRSDKQRGHSRRHAGFNGRWDHMTKDEQASMGRNKRDVWTVATRPFVGAHFAVFPAPLIEPCVLAGCPPGGTVLDPFGGAGTTSLVAARLGRNSIYIDLNPSYREMAVERLKQEVSQLTLFVDHKIEVVA